MAFIKEYGIKNAFTFKEQIFDFTNKKNEPLKNIFIFGKNNTGKTLLIDSLRGFSFFLKLNFTNGMKNIKFNPFDIKNPLMNYYFVIADSKYEYEYSIEINWKKSVITYEELKIRDLNALKSKWKKHFTFNSDDKDKIENIEFLSKDIKKAVKEHLNLNIIKHKNTKTLLSYLNHFDDEISKNVYEILTNISVVSQSGQMDENEKFNNKSFLKVLLNEKNREIAIDILHKFDLSIKNIEIYPVNEEVKSEIEITNESILKMMKETFKEEIKKDKNKDKDKNNFFIENKINVSLKNDEKAKEIFNFVFKKIKTLPKETKFHVNFARPDEEQKLYVFKIIDTKGNEFALREQSTGTIKIVRLICAYLISLKRESILLIDEFDSGIHSLLLAEVFNKTFALKNKKATTIIVTHNQDILDRKDIDTGQILLFDRDPITLETTVKYLSEFKTRKDSSLFKKYLQGSFGGVPNIG